MGNESNASCVTSACMWNMGAGDCDGAMIDLYKLRYFVTVARVGTFVQAAEELHVSQPALSRSIQSLERQFGVTLLDRG